MARVSKGNLQRTILDGVKRVTEDYAKYSVQRKGRRRFQNDLSNKNYAIGSDLLLTLINFFRGKE